MSDSVEEVKVKVTGDESSLDRALASALGLLNKFATGVDRAGKKIESGLGKAMNATGREADTLTTATERVGVSTRRMGEESGRGVSAVSRLAQEYRAGKMSADQYIASLEKVAKEAKDGSAEQLAALARLRSERERSARAAEQAAKQEATAARMVAKEVERAQKEQSASVARSTRETTRARQQAAREAQRAAKQESDAALQAAADAEKAAKRQEDAIRKVFEAENKRHSAKMQAAGAVGDGIQGTGNFLTKAVTAPLVLGASYAVKVTLDYDKAFSEVKKFTQGTKLQLGTLEKDLRALSLDKTVGTDFTDLANIASFGSQLGIERKNLKEFVKDVAYLGKAGDMSGEQAAVGLAKISSAMALPQGKIKSLASSLAAMGNLGSSTLDEILQTSRRFASEARMAKLDPSAVFAYANAVTSLGQEAEAGGSAITRTFDLVDKSVAEGGKSLEIFASVAGMTSKDFVKAYQTDAAGAVQKFFAGLDKQSQVAGRLGKILGALGIDDIRQQTAVKNLAAGHVQLAQNLKESARAYAAADEHQKKAAIAAEAYTAQLEQQKRDIMDAAFELGKSLVPTLLAATKAAKPLIEDARHLAEEFAKLSPEVQQTWIKVGLGVAVIGPLLTGIGSLVGWVIRLREGFALLKAVKTAEELVSITKAASAAATATSSVATAAGTVATQASAATGQVTALSTAMNALKAMGVIGLAVAVAYTAYKIAEPAGKALANSIYGNEDDPEDFERHQNNDPSVNNSLKEESKAVLPYLKQMRAFYAGGEKGRRPDSTKPLDVKLRISIEDEVTARIKADTKGLSPQTIRTQVLDRTIRTYERQAAARPDPKLIAQDRRVGSIESAAGAAETEIGKRLVRSAASIDFGGRNLSSACALFVTTALKKAGADFDGSNVAKDLRDKLLKAGGRAKPIGEAKPGDVIFFEGRGFGTIKDKNGNGFHTGVSMGGGMVRDEGSHGVRTRSIASVLGNQKGATAYAVSVPESLLTPAGVRRLNGEGETPTGSVPYNPNLFGPNPKKVRKKAAPTFMTSVPMASLEDLTGGNLDTAPTGAANYEAKLANLESLLASKQLALQQDAKKSGQSFDEFGFQVNALAQKLLLADNALQNTGAEIARLTPKVQADEAAYLASNKALNAQIALINGKRRAGKAVTADDNAQLTALRNNYKAAQKTYTDDKKALGENSQASRAATQQKIQDMNALAQAERSQLSERRSKFLKEQQDGLKAGKLTRTQYESNLKEALGRVGANSPDASGIQSALADSETSRGGMGKDLRKKTLLLDGKDFDAQRIELTEEVAAFRAAGADETEITAYEAKRRTQILHAEFEKQNGDAKAAHRADYESGTESLESYRAYLNSLMVKVKAEYGDTSAEAAKLNLEINKLNWDGASQEADKYREALDQGDISIQQYIAGLESLRNKVPQVSSEYRRMSREIDQSNRKIVADAHRTADETGRAFGDAAVSILRRSKTIGQAAKETLDSAVDGWIKETVKKVVSGFVFKAKMKDNAEKLQEIERQRQESVAKEAEGIAQFQASVAEFVGGVGDLGTALAGGVAGTTAAAGSTGTADVAGLATNVANNVANATTSKTVKDALGKTTTAISVAKDVSSGNASGALSTAASSGWLGKAAANAMPWVGVGLAALSLFGGSGLFSSQYRGFNTKEGGSVFSKIGKGDHTGLIDSGLSGPDGLRQLAAKAEAQKAQLSAPKTFNRNMTIASGGIVINTLPGQSTSEIAREVVKQLQEQSAMENSGMGSD